MGGAGSFWSTEGESSGGCRPSLMLLGRWQSNPSHCLPVAPPCLCLVCTSVSLRVLFLFYFFLQGTRGIFAPCACGLSLFSCVRRFATPCPPPGDLPNPGTEPVPLTSPAFAGEFSATGATWDGLLLHSPRLLMQEKVGLGMCSANSGF